MIIKYISKDGNWAETEDIVHIPENFIKIDNIYFEKKEEIKEVKKVEVKVETKEEVTEDVEARAKAFCKENKVKGYWIMKGDNLIKKAVENGFII